MSKKLVLKAKSAYGSQHGKSRRPDDDDENVIGGLKLLKRGMVTMNRITKRLIQGKRLKVQSNAQGEPVGKAAKEIQSYIGVLARTKIPISIADWRLVDPDEKDKIWESIEDSFVVHKEWKKLVIRSAANKWREFKSKLTNWYIMPYLETPELLEFPPDDYRLIEKDDWDIFVADRTSAGLQQHFKNSTITKSKRGRRISILIERRAKDTLIYKKNSFAFAKTIPIEDLDRATMWVKARQDKADNFKGPAVLQAASKIVPSSNLKSEFKLAIDSLDNIVAFGTIIQVDVEDTQQTIQGVQMGEENAHVSVTKAVVADALLPFPIKDEIVRVGDAIGTCVAWPKNWIIPPAVDEKENQKCKTVKSRKKDMYEDDDNDDLHTLPPKLPVSLKMLCQWANTFLKNGVTIHTTLGEEIFGQPRKVAIFKRDVYAMTNMKEISSSSIVMYMSCLYQVLKNSKILDMIAFLDPTHTGTLACGNPTERARHMSTHYAKGKTGQIFLVPYNSGCHWMLAIVNPTEEVVHFMDPLKR